MLESSPQTAVSRHNSEQSDLLQPIKHLIGKENLQGVDENR